MTEKEFYDSLNTAESTANGFNRLTRDQQLNAAYPVLMRKVFTWMALALAITGVVAWGVASSPAFVATLYQSSGLLIGLCIAEIALVWYVSARIQKLSLQTATTLFIIYSVLNGVTLSSIFLVYTMTSITSVFFITAGTFAAMALYGATTKKDLSKFGSLLFMALLGLIIATVVNMFVRSSGFSLIISYVGVLLFVGLTAWDTNQIKNALQNYAMDLSEGSQKIALLGALNLYLDFINLFLYLLRIFGRSDN